ncbi:hypothetical protein [Streptacidiphilus carbonis]|uniref:hypothetical protein n=1 Tax=Streptacidiphilus carbonis TaxID=105422 RepID=UPI00126A27A4|nr:hypothetical protein [Streptacidiphilus carbonis]
MTAVQLLPVIAPNPFPAWMLKVTVPEPVALPSFSNVSLRGQRVASHVPVFFHPPGERKWTPHAPSADWTWLHVGLGEAFEVGPEFDAEPLSVSFSCVKLCIPKKAAIASTALTMPTQRHTLSP